MKRVGKRCCRPRQSWQCTEVWDKHLSKLSERGCKLRQSRDVPSMFINTLTDVLFSQKPNVYDGTYLKWEELEKGVGRDGNVKRALIHVLQLLLESGVGVGDARVADGLPEQAATVATQLYHLRVLLPQPKRPATNTHSDRAVELSWYVGKFPPGLTFNDLIPD